MSNDSINPDLNGTVCCVGACLSVADVVGTVTLRTNPLVGAMPAESVHDLAVPLCIDHAHLLRMDPTLVTFTSGH